MANPTQPTNVSLGLYPTPGVTVTVSNVAGLPGTAASGDATIRSADMSIWDSTHNLYVPVEKTNQPVPND